MRNKKVFKLLRVISLVFILILTSSSLACVPPEEGYEEVAEIPLPWQSWETIDGGVMNIIVLSDEYTQAVVITRQWVTLNESIELNDLTWNETEMRVMELVGNWTGSDEEPVLLEPGSNVTLNISTTEEDAAVVLRYTVALASNPADVEVHVINEALLSYVQIEGTLASFKVHNRTFGEVDNFELEIKGFIQPSDIVGWYVGWGTPPVITVMPDGIKVTWRDPANPIQHCTSVNFGLYFKKGVAPTGIRASWTKTK
jgi:hypothetical protein